MATEKHVYVRNLNTVPIRVRLGSKKDPYEVNLERRGDQGDWSQVPASFENHPDFTRNLDVLYELISRSEAEALNYTDVDWDTLLIGDGRGVLGQATLADIHPEVRADYKNAKGDSTAIQKRDGGVIRRKPRRVSQSSDPYQAVGAEEALNPTAVGQTGPKSVTRRGRN